MPPISLMGSNVQDPSDRGTRHRWRFRNDCGEPIFDFYISTGPQSFWEIEFPWGDSGNPPDIRRVTLRESGFVDYTWEFDDEINVKIKFEPPISPGSEFELEIEFDDAFEPDEYIEFIPTNSNQVVLEGDNPTETSEPNSGIREVIESIPKIGSALDSLGIPKSKMKANFTFDQKTQKYRLSTLTPTE